MTDDDLSGAIFDINKKFTIISADEDSYSFEDILNNIEESIKGGKKIDMVLIDPWNEMESYRPIRMSETDYIGICLRDARRMARKLNISFWIVCHPAKPAQKNNNGEYNAPDMYDLAGSAHWYNKSDNAFILHRQNLNDTNCLLMIKKIKNRHYGMPGEVSFEFIPSSGRFEKPGNL